MKHIDELQVGGVIVDPILIEWLGDMVDEREDVVTKVVGDKKIVYGIDIVNGESTGGVVCYNGKLLYFSSRANLGKTLLYSDRPPKGQTLAVFNHPLIMRIA